MDDDDDRCMMLVQRYPVRVQCGDETRRHSIRVVVVRDCRSGWDVGRWVGRGIFMYIRHMKGVDGF